MADAGALGDIQWCLDDLIQELMAALVGYTGDIFVDNSSNLDPRYSPYTSCAGLLFMIITYQQQACIPINVAVGAATDTSFLWSACSCTEVEHPEHCTIGLAPDVVLADDVNRCVVLRHMPTHVCYQAGLGSSLHACMPEAPNQVELLSVGLLYLQGGDHAAAAAGVPLQADQEVHAAGAVPR
jgi:hypothetical protein